jgi:hypothetical protein
MCCDGAFSSDFHALEVMSQKPHFEIEKPLHSQRPRL